MPVFHGNRIRELREAQGMSGTKLAEMLSLSPQYLYELERGDKRLNEDILMQLANVFNVTTDLILGRDESLAETIKPMDADFEVLYRDFRELTSHDREVIMDLVRARRERLRKEGKIPDNKNDKTKD